MVIGIRVAYASTVAARSWIAESELEPEKTTLHENSWYSPVAKPTYTQVRIFY